MNGPVPRAEPEAAELERRIREWRRTGDLGRLWPDVAPADLRTAHARIRAVTEAVLRDGGASGGADLRSSPPADGGPEARARLASGERDVRSFLEAGGPDVRPFLAADGRREVRALGVAAFQGGMGPLLAWWIEEGRVAASDAAREVLLPHLDHGRHRIAMLRRQLTRIVRAMRSEGVDPVLLKGLHTGTEYFPDPATRPAADIDLLVRPGERDAAAAALDAAGFREARRTAAPDRSEWVPAGGVGPVRSLELEHAEGPWSVDLHTSLERWYFRGLRRGLGDDVFARTERVPLKEPGNGARERPGDGAWERRGGGARERPGDRPRGRDADGAPEDPGEGPRGGPGDGPSPDPGDRPRGGPGDGPSPEPAGAPQGNRSVRALGQPDLTAFLALHASYELVKVRLVRLVELVLVIRRDRESGRLADGDLAELIRRTHSGRFVHPALTLAEELVPGTVPARLLEDTGGRVTRRARRVIAAVAAADMAPLPRPSLDAKLMWARGIRQLLLNLSEVVLPSDEGLDVGPVGLQWRRLVALAKGRAGWRAGGGADTMEP